MAETVLKPTFKMVAPSDSQAACLQCGEVEHSLLFRKKNHDVVACDRCGFAYVVDMHPRSETWDL